jgi:hypothetical protein
LIFAAKLLDANLFNGYDQSTQMTMVIIPLFQLLEHFVEEYFDQNPISQLGIIGTRNKRAEIIAELGGNGCCPPFDYYMYI